MVSTGRKITVFAITAAALLALFFVAVNTGSLQVTPEQLLGGLFVEYDDTVATIYDLRFPRIFIAMVGGAALAASGTSVITHPEHIDRGYAAFTEILASLGAQIRREAPLRNTTAKKTSSKKQNHLAIGPKRWYDTVI